jgi:tRNA (guanine37-N1)-methyltransferase
VKKSACIKTQKRNGEEIIALINRLGMVDKNLEIQRDAESVYIPLTRRPTVKELKTVKQKVTDCQISEHYFPEKKKRTMPLAQLLEDKLPPHLLASLPRAIDFVGDIAIIDIPPELAEHGPAIGEAVLKANKNVHTVLAKAGAVSGTYRLREFAVIAGENKTETIHKEYGCQYYVDVAKTFFSPRLSFEHHRVASLAKDDETVVDLFAGIGPFSIQIAKNHQNVNIYAVDVNPDAFEYLKKNIRVNRVVEKVHPLLGDARQLVKARLASIADRAIMNLPEKAIQYLDVACEAIKPSGGTIHFYTFVDSTSYKETTEPLLVEHIQKCGRQVEAIPFSRLVRATAPREWQAVFDIKIR